MNGKLTLVGAGPGHEEMITLQALKAIKAANVILYDSLASEEVLQYAPVHTLYIYVGKSLGKYQYTQSQINEMIVKYAFEYGHVVRLKGGDPFVFGRGMEEIQYAESFGIETQIISGISSSIAVPASVGIPVTSRGVSDSFWVLTGTKQDGSIAKDIHLAAQSSATIIILMGMSRLVEICQIFEAQGSGQQPVAVIQNGTKAKAKYVLGQINNISEKVKQQGLSNPAIIIIGEVVKLHKEYESMNEWLMAKI